MNTPINPVVDVPDQFRYSYFCDERPGKNLGKVTLYRGVFPIYFKIEANQDHVEVNRNIECKIIYPKTDFLG